MRSVTRQLAINSRCGFKWTDVGKLLVIAGLVIAAVGVLIMLGVPLGRLPGDISYERGNTRFYFPIVTCLLLSVLFTIVMALLRR